MRPTIAGQLLSVAGAACERPGARHASSKPVAHNQQRVKRFQAAMHAIGSSLVYFFKL